MTTCTNIFKSLVLEIRPRLQSVNVLINLSRPITNLRVQLNDDHFELISTEITTRINCNRLQIVPNSLSSLCIEPGYVSFRFATTSGLGEWSGFEMELLRVSDAPSAARGGPLATFLRKATRYRLRCRNCTGALAEAVEFRRVLPLPSESATPGDWFCHGQGAGAAPSLDPGADEVFYTGTYCHVARRLVGGSVVVNERVVCCKRCFQWLGVAESGETVRLWFGTVSFWVGEREFRSAALADCFGVLAGVLDGVLFNSAKVILRCESAPRKVDRLLIWVLEKELRVQFGYCRGERQTDEDCRVAKVLFRYEEEGGEVGQKWEKEPNVSVVDVSKPMFVELLKYLYRFNKIFPADFGKSNQFYISYLKLYGD